MKKWLSLVLACAMMLSLFVGCGQKTEEPAPAEPEQTEEPAEKEEAKPEEKEEEKEEVDPNAPVMNTDEKITLTWSIPTQQTVPLNETPLFADICEKLNIEVKLTELPVGQYAEKKKLLISSKEIPDIMSWVQYAEAAEYGPVGAFLDLNKYIDYMPNFKANMEEQLAKNPDQSSVLYNEGGAIYRAPHTLKHPVPIFDFSINKTAFEEVGYTEIKTMDDFYNGLKALKEAHPESYPLSFAFGNGLQPILQLFCMSYSGGVTDSGFMGFDYNKDEFVFGPAQEGYKKAVALFAKMYAEGIIDPEYSVVELNKMVQQMNEGRVFATCNYVGGLTGISSVMKDVTIDLVPIPLPQGDDQPQVISKQMLNFDGFAGTCLSAEIAKDPVKLGRCLQFIDYVYSEDFYNVQWFHPDVTNEDGSYNEKVYTLDDNYQTIKDTYFPWSMMAIFQDACDERPLPGSAYQIYRDEYLLAPENADKYVRNPMVSLTADQQEDVNKCMNAIGDRFNVRISEFCEGKVSMDEWDAFVAELMEAGGNRLVEINNEAYQASK